MNTGYKSRGRRGSDNEADPRILWLASKISTYVHIPEKEATRLLKIDSNREHLLKFLESSQHQRFFVWKEGVDEAPQLSSAFEYPAEHGFAQDVTSGGHRVAYFIKHISQGVLPGGSNGGSVPNIASSTRGPGSGGAAGGYSTSREGWKDEDDGVETDKGATENIEKTYHGDDAMKVWGFRVLHGVLPVPPLDFIRQISQGVFLPMVKFRGKTWPRVVLEDLTSHMLVLANQAHVILGQVKGETYLATAGSELAQFEDSKTAGTDSDTSAVLALERVVNEWSRQVHSVLETEPAQLLHLNPGPLVEIDFWDAKLANVISIHRQLLVNSVQKVSEALSSVGSSYHAPLKRILSMVSTAIRDTEDTCRYMTAVRPYAEAFDELHLLELPQVFVPTLHTVYLVWKHSRTYRSTHHIVTLLTEFSNALADKVCDYISNCQLMDVDEDEGLADISVALSIIGQFKEAIITYRALAGREEGVIDPEHQWRFDSSIVCTRLNTVVDRCRDLEYVLTAREAFSKLDKVEIHGFKGKALTQEVVRVHSEFESAFKQFSAYGRVAMKFDDELAKARGGLLDNSLSAAARAVAAGISAQQPAGGPDRHPGGSSTALTGLAPPPAPAMQNTIAPNLPPAPPPAPPPAGAGANAATHVHGGRRGTVGPSTSFGPVSSMSSTLGVLPNLSEADVQPSALLGTGGSSGGLGLSMGGSLGANAFKGLGDGAGGADDEMEHRGHKDDKSASKDMSVAVADEVEHDVQVASSVTTAFDLAFLSFRRAVSMLERSIVAIITEGCESSPNRLTTLKLFLSFDMFLRRRTVRLSVWPYIRTLLAEVHAEVDAVYSTFRSHRQCPPLCKNMPPTAGVIMWARCLVDKMSPYMDRLSLLDPVVSQSEDAVLAFHLHRKVLNTVRQFETQKFEDWCKTFDSIALGKLGQPVLRFVSKTPNSPQSVSTVSPPDSPSEPPLTTIAFVRSKNQNLSSGAVPESALVDSTELPLDVPVDVNFDPQLVTLAREVRYLRLLGFAVPQEIESLFLLCDGYRDHSQTLQATIQSFNDLRESLMDQERPLVQSSLDELQRRLHRGINELTWNSPDLISYIEGLKDKTTDLRRRIEESRRLVAAALEALTGLTTHSVLEKVQHEALSPEEISKQLNRQVSSFSQQTNCISTLLLDVARTLQVQMEGTVWLSYAEYINGLICDELRLVTHSLLDYFFESLAGPAGVSTEDAQTPQQKTSKHGEPSSASSRKEITSRKEMWFKSLSKLRSSTHNLMLRDEASPEHDSSPRGSPATVASLGSAPTTTPTQQRSRLVRQRNTKTAVVSEAPATDPFLLVQIMIRGDLVAFIPGLTTDVAVENTETNKTNTWLAKQLLNSSGGSFVMRASLRDVVASWIRAVLELANHVPFVVPSSLLPHSRRSISGDRLRRSVSGGAAAADSPVTIALRTAMDEAIHENDEDFYSTSEDDDDDDDDDDGYTGTTDSHIDSHIDSLLAAAHGSEPFAPVSFTSSPSTVHGSPDRHTLVASAPIPERSSPLGPSTPSPRGRSRLMSYSAEVCQDPTVKKRVADIMTLVAKAEEAAQEYRQRFDRFSFLWESDPVNAVFDFAEAHTSGESASGNTATATDRGRSSRGLTKTRSGRGATPDDTLRTTLKSDTSAIAAAVRAPEHAIVHGAALATLSANRPLEPNADFENTKAEMLPMPDLEAFQAKVDSIDALIAEISEIPLTEQVSFMLIDHTALKQDLVMLSSRWRKEFTTYLADALQDQFQYWHAFVKEAGTRIQDCDVSSNVNKQKLLETTAVLLEVRRKGENMGLVFEELRQAVALLKKLGHEMEGNLLNDLDFLPKLWASLQRRCVEVKMHLGPAQASCATQIHASADKLEAETANELENFHENGPFYLPLEVESLDKAYKELDKFHLRLVALEEQVEDVVSSQRLFEMTERSFPALTQCREEMRALKSLWDVLGAGLARLREWHNMPFMDLNLDELEAECESLLNEIRGVGGVYKGWVLYDDAVRSWESFGKSFSTIKLLRQPFIRQRHWTQLMDAAKLVFIVDEYFTLQDFLRLRLFDFESDITSIVELAKKELEVETLLVEIEKVWASIQYDLVPDDEEETENPVLLLKSADTLMETLEDNQITLQNLLESPYSSCFFSRLSDLMSVLRLVDDVTSEWIQAQRTFTHVKGIYMTSKDLRAELLDDVRRFDAAYATWRRAMDTVAKDPRPVHVCKLPNALDRIRDLHATFQQCGKSLAGFLEKKQLAFPRFYFISLHDLLDILAHSDNTPRVLPLCCKMFSNLKDLTSNAPRQLPAVLLKTAAAAPVPVERTDREAYGFVSEEGEWLAFKEPVHLHGQSEKWLADVLEGLHGTVQQLVTEAITTYGEHQLNDWILTHCTQAVLVAAAAWYTHEVSLAFDKLQQGNERAMREYLRVRLTRIATLTRLLEGGQLSELEQQKVMNLLTFNIHARDVLEALIMHQTERPDSFLWTGQLRVSWDEETNLCAVEIADASFPYFYEYLGCRASLVITPLTDRVFVTLTQALKFNMGGMLLGPAGTGKTETTKELGRGLGRPVFVFNCGQHMDTKTLGTLFKGFAMTGAWGCFDEINRLGSEVLSVMSMQLKTILDAIRAQANELTFEGDVITLDPGCAVFVTMNPGYAGRTELPESLKSLLRPVVMAVPDVRIICEILLAAQGFTDAKQLASKVETVFRLARDVLGSGGHYYWGLRSVKTALVVAGRLRRVAPAGMHGVDIVLAAIKECTLSKIRGEDRDVFISLLLGVFPTVRDNAIKSDTSSVSLVGGVAGGAAVADAISQAIVARKLHPGGEMFEATQRRFCHRIAQLHSQLLVHHCVYILGPTGCGKSECWQTLLSALRALGHVTHVSDMEPKAVKPEQLYGYVHPITREWQDGLFSRTMREYAQMSGKEDKWIVLDGDIDPSWIESLNSVMDDNKILTLASNERISLTPSMRLIFESTSLQHATPATISRAGIVYLNREDVRWPAYQQRWVHSRTDPTEKSTLSLLFGRYVGLIIDFFRDENVPLIQNTDLALITAVCSLLEHLLAPGLTPDQIENVFAFACIWGFGSSVAGEGSLDPRAEFSTWWKQEFKHVKFDDKASIFDYGLSPKTYHMVPWRMLVTPGPAGADLLLRGDRLIITPEVAAMCGVVDVYLQARLPLFLAGPAGCGKTSVLRHRVAAKCADETEGTQVCSLSCDYYTDATAVQTLLEGQLERKAGRILSPPQAQKLVYHIDDVHVPYVDEYGTRSMVAFVRQLLQYQHIYTKDSLALHEVHDVQIVGTFDPAGPGTRSGRHHPPLDDRFLRHFGILWVPSPSRQCLQGIFTKLLEGHPSYSAGCGHVLAQIVDASLDLHELVQKSFVATVSKIHYVFSLHDMRQIFDGFLSIDAQGARDGSDVIRAWINEAYSTYGDRLVSPADKKTLKQDLGAVVRNHFTDLPFNVLFPEPLIYCNFLDGPPQRSQAAADKAGSTRTLDYDDATSHPTWSLFKQAQSYSSLSRILDGVLDEYNKTHATALRTMAFFDDSIRQLIAICHILGAPRGHPVLVGLSGSGQDPLAVLASYICGFEVFSVQGLKSYTLSSFKEDLRMLCMKTGLGKERHVLLLSQEDVLTDEMLSLANAVMSQGYVSDLFVADDYEIMGRELRRELRKEGAMGSMQNIVAQFTANVLANLRVVLIVSSMGTGFSQFTFRFPALTGKGRVVFFPPWPREALQTLASSMVEGVDQLSAALIGKVAANIQLSLEEASSQYYEMERRHFYPTPRGYMAFLHAFNTLLRKRKGLHRTLVSRLRNGLVKLETTQKDVAILEGKILEGRKLVSARKEATLELLKKVSTEQAAAETEQRAASEKQVQCEEVSAQVAEQRHACSEDLARAEPAIKAAEDALEHLDKAGLIEIKSFTQPPKDVHSVLECVCLLLGGVSTNRSSDKASWLALKKVLSNVEHFVDQLVNFDRNNIEPNIVRQVKSKFISQAWFNPSSIEKKSRAAAGLCEWARNIIAYYDIYLEVKPKRDALEEVTNLLKASEARLDAAKARAAEATTKMDELKAEYERATIEKNHMVRLAEEAEQRLDLANRLVRGLASEKLRWQDTLTKMRENEKHLVGNTLLVAAFVSFSGIFTTRPRATLLDKWRKFLESADILYSKDASILDMLVSERIVATWLEKGLPDNQYFKESAAILANTLRWPLLIDPQLQAAQWLKQFPSIFVEDRSSDAPSRKDTQQSRRSRFDLHAGLSPQRPSARSVESDDAPKLVVIQWGVKGCARDLASAIKTGALTLVMSITEDLDPVFLDLIGKFSFKRKARAGEGQKLVELVRVGDVEVESHPNSRVVLHTTLANPNFLPLIQSQTNLIDFTVTESSLEEQVLGIVVNLEKPDQEKNKRRIIAQRYAYDVRIKELEDGLLECLSAAQGDVLGDVDLIERIEKTKSVASDIQAKVEEARKQELEINKTREIYRPIATWGAMLFFLMRDLGRMSPIYKYSLRSFLDILLKALTKASKSCTETADSPDRVAALREAATYAIYVHVSRGLSRDFKIVFAAQLCLRSLLLANELDPEEYEHLIRGNSEVGPAGPQGDPRGAGANPVSDWLADQQWRNVLALATLTSFQTLSQDLQGTPKRWKEWCQSERPEDARLPQEWSRATPFQRLLLVKAIRPDRLPMALLAFVSARLGSKYTEFPGVDVRTVLLDSSPAHPVYFVMSPGMDIVKELEDVVSQDHVTSRMKVLSMGQGMEAQAEGLFTQFVKEGGWLVLQNVHFMPKWLPTLIHMLSEVREADAHPEFRLFFTAPAPHPGQPCLLPDALLENSLKVTSEPADGVRPNTLTALQYVPASLVESSQRPRDFATCVFALCFFHARCLGRARFGPQGWYGGYSFGPAEIRLSCYVLHSAMESTEDVIWENVRTMLGDVVYGGQIVDEFDRRTLRAYLDGCFHDYMFDALEKMLGAACPPTGTIKAYSKFMSELQLFENPQVYGLPPAADYIYRITQAKFINESFIAVQPTLDLVAQTTVTADVTDEKTKMESLIHELRVLVPDDLRAEEAAVRASRSSVYTPPLLSELSRAITLTTVVHQSLDEALSVLEGEATLTSEIEEFIHCLRDGKIPPRWAPLSFPMYNVLPVASWLRELRRRCDHLVHWCSNVSDGVMNLPPVLDVSCLFDARPLLAALLLNASSLTTVAVEKLEVGMEITKKRNAEDVTRGSREGMYVTGMVLQGATWDDKQGCLVESQPKDLFSELPVVYLKVVPKEGRDFGMMGAYGSGPSGENDSVYPQAPFGRGLRSNYRCPVYQTLRRGASDLICEVDVRTRENPTTWTLAGVAIFLEQSK
eukprot:Rmarinus@m.11280